jgi:hypothetical protein
LVGLAAAASAVPWSQSAGDPGHSSYQPRNIGVPPIVFQYSKTADKTVATSIVISDPISEAPINGSQVAVYGTTQGREGTQTAGTARLHMQRLDTGAPIGPEQGTLLNDSPDVAALGSGLGHIDPVETSGFGGSGPAPQVIQVHNDDAITDVSDQISISTFNMTNGLRNQFDALEQTNSYEMNSSPLLVGSGDTLNLFFIAQYTQFPPRTIGAGPGAHEATDALFKVPVFNSRSDSISFGTPVLLELGNSADQLTSPTLVVLNDPTTVADDPTSYVAVAFDSATTTIKTFRVTDLVAGPTFAAGGTVDDVGTPATPVMENGYAPGTGPSPAVDRTPYIYVATGAEGNSPTTTVHKVQQVGNSATLTLAGTATTAKFTGNGLNSFTPFAITQVATPGGTSGGRVIVATERNLFSLNADNLSDSESFSVPNLTAGTTGFSRVTPAASGDFVYATRDNGTQLVLTEVNLDPVAGFAQQTGDPGNEGSVFAIGNPGISNRYVGFGSNKGFFVYRSQPLPLPPPGQISIGDTGLSEGNPGDPKIAPFTVTKGTEGGGQVTVHYETVDGTATAGDDYVPVADGILTIPAGQTTGQIAIEVVADSVNEPDETFFVRLKDPSGALLADDTGVATIANDDPAAPPVDLPPTVQITEPTDRQQLTPGTTYAIKATASDDKGIVSVTFRRGGNVLLTDTEAPYETSYTPTSEEAGAQSITATATDTVGQTSTAAISVEVTRPVGPGDDKPPVLTITSPRTVGTRINAGRAFSLAADAADDKLLKTVQFLVGDRQVCSLTSAPFRCSFRPALRDLGRQVVTVTATDSIGQTTTQQRSIVVQRFKARGLTSVVKPKRDTVKPFVFVVTGRLGLPAGVSRVQGCGGKVRVRFSNAAGRSLLTRTLNLSRGCTYRVVGSFKSAVPFGRTGRVTIISQFLGNSALAPVNATRRTAFVK